MSVAHHRVYKPEKDLPEDFFLILYGIRRCGKSNALKQIMYDMRDRFKNYRAFIFSGTAKVDPEQYTYFPKESQYHDMSRLENDLQEVVNTQEELLDVPIANRAEVLEKNRMIIVLDDCVNENTVRSSKTLDYLAVSGRHIGASVIILSQCICGSGSVPPIIRNNADAIIMCTLPRAATERELLCSYYLQATSKMNKNQCLSLLEEFTAVKYRCMVITMYDSSARTTQQYVYVYGPVPFPAATKDFKIGTTEQWSEGAQEPFSDSDSDNGKNNSDTAESKAVYADGANDAHGGTGYESKGISAPMAAQSRLLTRPLAVQRRPSTAQYLPPALTGDNTGVKMRNFSSMTMRGSAAVDEFETEDFSLGMPVKNKTFVLQGWSEEKPERKRKSEIIKLLKNPNKRTRRKWGNLRAAPEEKYSQNARRR
jgi:hypothetical protein